MVLGVTDSQINLLTETQAHDKSEENFSQVLSESSNRDSP
ncbi:MAG: flagellar biosynthetic protein FliO [Desulfonatronovibrionaceae bacterium]